MRLINYYLSSSIVFWLAWIIIPFIMEIMPAFFNFLILLKKKIIFKKVKNLEYYPEITLIIPVYNSGETLKECLGSVYNSEYPNELIYIMLVNNQGQDNSFKIFCECQNEFPELTINWLNAKQGKSKALNLALFNSDGRYIINIDSDGVFHPQALKNIVTKFENEISTHCVTGVIMTNHNMIDETKNFAMRILRNSEYFEYCQAFLAGRNFQSEFNSIYTLSGAFSAFRKSAILKTQLYNTDTVGEDTHVTFQIRDNMKLNVSLCENAFFFVDPIENIDKLYTQRQRWQRGELEVAHMFMKDDLSAFEGFFSNFIIRIIMYDHTFAFPRMIWYFALLCLAFINYSTGLIIFSVVLIYLLYVFSAFLFYLNIIWYLSEYKELRSYYSKKWYFVFIMPLFNFMLFWIRFAGIINSISSEQSWKTRTLTQEWSKVVELITKDFFVFTNILKKTKEKVNKR